MKKSKELRYAAIEPSGVNDLVLVGRPIVFDSPATINLENGESFTEIISRSALDHCDLSDSTLIYNHDTNRVPLARTGRTMTLRVTEDGLYMRAELAGDSPQAQEVYSAVKRGDLSGMSFAFVVSEGGSSYDPATNTRTITDIAKVYEISITPYPAYASASVEARDAITAARDAERARVQARALRIAALARSARITNHEIG